MLLDVDSCILNQEKAFSLEKEHSLTRVSLRIDLTAHGQQNQAK